MRTVDVMLKQAQDALNVQDIHVDHYDAEEGILHVGLGVMIRITHDDNFLVEKLVGVDYLEVETHQEAKVRLDDAIESLTDSSVQIGDANVDRVMGQRIVTLGRECTDLSEVCRWCNMWLR